MWQLERRTLQAVLKRSTQFYPQHTALSYADGNPINYFELKGQVDRLSAFLQDQGVGEGDRVALVGENSPNWGIAFFTVTTMGAVAVPILPDFHTSEIHHILRHSGSKAVFISERYYHKIEDFGLDDFTAVVLLDDFS
ncbi:MAG: AMP-binding protein, partial [Bacteroidota bacterium]